VRSTYHGRIEARNEVTVMSGYKGFATVVELAREGSRVRPGEVLARFDSAELERELLRLEEAFALAQSERESQHNAIIPMELDNLELELRKASEAAAAEEQYLQDSLSLAQENVVSGQEIEQQKARVAQLDAEYQGIKRRLELTRTYLHPAMRQRADAKLHAARRALELARQQLENTVIRAPAGGVVVYKPLHIGGEFRTLRIGDSLHANQPFMLLTDLHDLILTTVVPEHELTRVSPGQSAMVIPRAFPEARLDAVVERVGVVAETVPDRPVWQKYFRLDVGIDQRDKRLRPGMSATVHIISEGRADALLVTRRAVVWRDGEPMCRVRNSINGEERVLQLGVADESHFEVLGGLRQGDRVVLR